ncbi:hypothetical protein LMIY3S_05451 [Labrys miyagiensis]
MSQYENPSVRTGGRHHDTRGDPRAFRQGNVPQSAAGQERTKTEGHSMKNGQRSQPADVN